MRGTRWYEFCIFLYCLIIYHTNMYVFLLYQWPCHTFFSEPFIITCERLNTYSTERTSVQTTTTPPENKLGGGSIIFCYYYYRYPAGVFSFQPVWQCMQCLVLHILHFHWLSVMLCYISSQHIVKFVFPFSSFLHFWFTYIYMHSFMSSFVRFVLPRVTVMTREITLLTRGFRVIIKVFIVDQGLRYSDQGA